MPGFTTASFGQAWMQMQLPAAETKFNLPCPPSVAQSLSQPEAYSQLLGQKIGIQKVEVINNEVIAAGRLTMNAQVYALVHCRVTPAQLEFTVRSATAETTQSVVADLKVAMV